MRPDFLERMQTGRDLAQARRDRGLHTGKSAAGWDNVKRRPLESWEAKLEEARVRFILAMDEAKERHHRAAFPQRYADCEIPF